ncbi:DsbA family oxidoreductase [Photobacterium sp. 2_MG-2023]|uniref:DsbA family oxidoreductase n=1 Tax=Photobacterium sp. 2_MG-2023 TaxID=3062663 RepID=UPI0026E30723|nr:DsbA family oxidoreductase [Photobacterium sp. 2_MG-2023]MDO6582238.1 DsbA family oxidoreductase [Photobacterium sp. 2_MG-2023]
MSHQLTIDVYFDFICPWCLICKKHLDEALVQLFKEEPTIRVAIQWHGVQLLPDLPEQGVPFDAFYLQRLGSAAAVSERRRQVHQAAMKVGVAIDFSSIRKMPNTAMAHQMFQQAVSLGGTVRQEALLERMLSAYFLRGEDISDPDTLAAIAEECGYHRLDLGFDAQQGDAPFSTSDLSHKQLPYSVPYIVLNERLALSGAQNADELQDAFRYILSLTSTPVHG